MRAVIAFFLTIATFSLCDRAEALPISRKTCESVLASYKAVKRLSLSAVDKLQQYLGGKIEFPNEILAKNQDRDLQTSLEILKSVPKKDRLGAFLFLSMLRLAKIYENPGWQYLSAKEMSIVRKYLLHPTSTHEKQLDQSIEDNAFKDDIKFLAQKSFLKVRLPLLIKSLFRGEPALPLLPKREGIFRRSLNLLGNGMGAVGEFIYWAVNPVFPHIKLAFRSVRKIQDKLRSNPEDELSPSQVEYIEQNGLGKDVNNLRHFYGGQSWLGRSWSQFKKMAFHSVPKVAGALTAALLFFDIDTAGSLQTVVNKLLSKDSISRVWLLTDVEIAIPHTALFIDGMVYSFGKSQLDVVPLALYVQTSNYNHGVFFTPVFLEDEKVDQLRSYLKNNAWKDYLNISGLNDCTTMGVCTLEMIDPNIHVPSIVAVSPTSSLAYLNMLHLWGDTHFGRTLYVNTRTTNSRLDQLNASFYDDLGRFPVHALEARLTALLAPVIYFGQPNETVDEMLWDAPEIQEYYRGQEQKYSDEISKSVEVQSWIKRKEFAKLLLQQTDDSVKRKPLQQMIVDVQAEAKGFINDRLRKLEDVIQHDPAVDVRDIRAQMAALKNVLEKISGD